MATREQQRARTKRAIVDAATRLLADGRNDLSMEEIAEAANVSRATIYRHFDSAADIVWHSYADQLVESPEPDEVMHGVDDIVDRVLIAERMINDFLFDDPDRARAFEHTTLTRTLNGSEADRPARRLVYIDAALSPIARDLGPHLDDIRHALALAMGSQIVPVMLDTCRLPVDDARRATRFACRTIAEAAVHLARGDGAPA